MDTPLLFSLDGLSLSPYGLTMAAGAALALLLTWKLKESHAITAALWSLPLAVIFGHLVWCLASLDTLGVNYASGYSLILMPWLGGYTLYGAVLGGIIGTFIAARQTHASFFRLLDSLTPGACISLIFGRLAEVFIGQGVGPQIEEGGPRFFPIAICTYADEYWQDWQLCVFFWEALFALIMLLVMLRLRKSPRNDGTLAGTFLILLGTSQIFFEQLRRDDKLLFGFVISFTQIAALVFILCVLAFRLSRHRSQRDLLRMSVFLFGLACVILIEFAFDKPQVYLALQLCLLAEAILFSVLLLTPTRTFLRFILSAGILVFSIIAGLQLGKDPASEQILLFGMMAMALVPMTAVCLNVGTSPS